MVGWEPPGQDGVPDAERLFETIWTADRETARSAARICCGLAAADAHDRRADRRSGSPSRCAGSGDELRRAEALTGADDRLPGRPR